MVNVVIYLKKKFNAEELVTFLLSKKLIATASIDENNNSYIMQNGLLHKELYSVITAKTKSLLVHSIIEEVEKRTDGEVLINSTPIVGTNKFFDDLVKQNTMRI